MEQVRCTNCGSTAIIPDGTGEFCKCEACGSTFAVARAAAFSKVVLDHTQDIRAWREYLAKQLKLQQDSTKARDYGGVKLFAQKILSVLPDDFRAQYYSALADRFDGNDTAFTEFVKNIGFASVAPEEIRDVTTSLVATVEPKYLDAVKDFIKRAYPATAANFDAILDRNIKVYIQKLRNAKVSERDVFICHRTAEPDQDIADAICTRLEERGLRCWIAPRNILAGSQNYERDILKGVENSRIFLLVSSFKSIYSEDCEMELKAAVLDGKALYSYRIDDTPYDGAFDKALSGVQWLDASDDPYAHLEQLVIDIKGILARDEREKAELEEKRLAAREKERKESEARRTAEQQRLDRLEQLVSSGVAVNPVAAHGNMSKSRLKRAEIEVQSENYDRAMSIIDEVLDVDPENGLAWWLSILCEYRLPTDEDLLKSGVDFTAHKYYKTAERFAVGEFATRLREVTERFQTVAVKSVNDSLASATARLGLEDFDGLKTELDGCAAAFSDEDSIIFRRFPDIASRYYWLRLWCKYGQTELVCVEDITREREYELAFKYASPAQAREYAAARQTVSKNAQLFLRERSKNRSNDGKLVDYLVDNKNILPIDIYNYYSSLLYFRKMLSQLNMTEVQLRASAVDITTNEYFMLAQSLASSEQKRTYDALLQTLEKNRADKARRDADSKARHEAAMRRAASRAVGSKAAKTTIATILGSLSLMLFIAGLANIFGSSERMTSIMLFSVLFKLASDIIILNTDSKMLKILSSFLLVSSIITLCVSVGAGMCGACIEVIFESEEDALVSIGLSVIVSLLSIACAVLEIIGLAKSHKPKNNGGKQS